MSQLDVGVRAVDGPAGVRCRDLDDFIERARVKPETCVTSTDTG